MPEKDWLMEAAIDDALAEEERWYQKEKARRENLKEAWWEEMTHEKCDAEMRRIAEELEAVKELIRVNEIHRKQKWAKWILSL